MPQFSTDAAAAAAARPVNESERLDKRVLELETELVEQKRELARVHEETRHLLHVLSHDMRESSRMVRSYIQLLARRYKDKLDSDAGEFIGFALDGAARMDELLDDLLEYSRTVNAPVRAFEQAPLEFVVGQAIAHLDGTIRETGAIVTHDPVPTLPGDAAQLQRLFVHLLDNALKFRGSDSPRIHIGAVPEAEDWHFTVRDNGQGIRSDYHEVIFSPFRRLHGRDYPGTGMGLAIARRIVERHGGRIWVTSSEGKGAAFHFILRG